MAKIAKALNASLDDLIKLYKGRVKNFNLNSKNMNEEKKEYIIKPDPSIVLEKLIKPCMIWHHKAFGVLLILGGIWWYLRNLGLVSNSAFWPGLLILLGILVLAEIKFFWKKL